MKKQLLPTLISVLALCISCYAAFLCDKRIEADWMGVLVGVLSLLVTAVIGLNIYTLVDFKNATKKVEELKETMVKDDNASLAMSTHDTFMIYHYLLLQRDPAGLEFRFISSGIHCLIHSSKAGDFENCNWVLKIITDSIIEPNRISIDKESKEYLLTKLSEIQQPKSIKDFHVLVELVVSVNVIGT